MTLDVLETIGGLAVDAVASYLLHHARQENRKKNEVDVYVSALGDDEYEIRIDNAKQVVITVRRHDDAGS